MTGTPSSPLRLRRRHRSAALLIAAAAAQFGMALAVMAGLRVNTTASMPSGLWRISPIQGAVARGSVVSLCPPDDDFFRLARWRGYIGAGKCPGGYEPLLKPVAAIAGDIVLATTAGIAVNGISVADSAALSRDSAGRPLQPMPPGIYHVRARELWLLSGHNPRSFDSRYFGVVPAANIEGIARPLWMIR
jgi:conjugative transfer signal peptidase TraF